MVVDRAMMVDSKGECRGDGRSREELAKGSSQLFLYGRAGYDATIPTGYLRSNTIDYVLVSIPRVLNLGRYSEFKLQLVCLFNSSTTQQQTVQLPSIHNPGLQNQHPTQQHLGLIFPSQVVICSYMSPRYCANHVCVLPRSPGVIFAALG